MKKIFLFASALAGLFLAASCQRENLEPVGGSNVVSYTIQVPGAIGTKAIGEDVTNVNELVYEVYRTEAATADNHSAAETKLFRKTATIEKGVAKINFELVNNQNFRVLFWAQVKDNGIYTTDDLKNVSVKQALSANYESYAAFAGTDFIKYGDDIAGRTVTLVRPVAQLNIATTEASLTIEGQTAVKVATTGVKVSGLSTSYNVAQGLAGNVAETEYVYAATDPSKLSEKTLTVNGEDYSYISMNYVGFAEQTGNNVEVSYTINTENVGTISNTINNVPVKPNYRTNIVGNLITSTSDYTVTLDAEWGDADEPSNEVYIVATDEQLAEALKSEAEVINVVLAADLNLNANDAYLKLGTANTKKIIFDGLKATTKSASADFYTLTLKTNYWSRLNTTNPDAKIVLRNLNLTSSQVEGTWDSYDVTFQCNVEMENVNLLKALALDGEGKTAVLKNVNISESNDYYALWITACGQNVEWNGGSVVSAGRGIKIDQEYVKTPSKVTLKVSGVKFTTVKKAAILVLSSAGAAIEVADLDIADVKADPVNAVWVDEKAADYFDLVTVEGGSKILEGSADVPFVVTDTDGLNKALAEGVSMIYLKAGNYALAKPTIKSENVTIQGQDRENCVLTITKQIRAVDGKTCLTLKNLTTDVPTGLTYNEFDFAWIHYLKEFNMLDCNSNGRIRLNCHSANIEGCDFTVTTSGGFDGYAIQYQGATESNVKVSSCTFNTAGKAIVMYNEGPNKLNLDVDKCKFVSSNFSTDKAAIQMHTELGISGTLDITECEATGFADVNGGLWNEINNNSGDPTYNFTITVDGVDARPADVVYVTPSNLATTDFNQSKTFMLVGDFSSVTDIKITPAEGVEAVIDASQAKLAERIRFSIPSAPDAQKYVTRNEKRIGSYKLTAFQNTTLNIGAYGTSVAVTESTLDCIDVYAANIAMDVTGNTIDGNYEAHPRYSEGYTTDYCVYLMMMAYDLTFNDNIVSNAKSHAVAINGLTTTFGTSVENSGNEVKSFTGNTIKGLSGVKDGRAGLKVWDDKTYALNGVTEFNALPEAGQNLIKTIDADATNVFEKAEGANTAYKMNFYDYNHSQF